MRFPSSFKGTIEIGFLPRCQGIQKEEADTGLIQGGFTLVVN